MCARCEASHLCIVWRSGVVIQVGRGTVADIGSEGVVLGAAAKNGDVQVKVGPLTVKSKLDRLRKLPKSAASSPKGGRMGSTGKGGGGGGDGRKKEKRVQANVGPCCTHACQHFGPAWFPCRGCGAGRRQLP